MDSSNENLPSDQSVTRVELISRTEPRKTEENTLTTNQTESFVKIKATNGAFNIKQTTITETEATTETAPVRVGEENELSIRKEETVLGKSLDTKIPEISEPSLLPSNSISEEELKGTKVQSRGRGAFQVSLTPQ